MSRTSSNNDFIMSKWYADVIDAKTNDVSIFYLARLKWKLLNLSFFNVVQFLNRNSLNSNAKFVDYKEPVLGDDGFLIEHENIRGEWRRLRKGVSEKMFENDNGEFILWECFMPLADAAATFNSEVGFNGLGYVERLTSTIKPWNMPMSNLRWGRFLANDHYVIWIWWIGSGSYKSLIFHNGRRITNGLINDHEIRFDDYRLVLNEKHVLRNGELADTVFKQFEWFRNLFTNGILRLKECKWQTKGQFFIKNEKIAEGWSIHEHVEWRQTFGFGNMLGKLLYGGLFTVILPIMMVLMAMQIEPFITLPVPSVSNSVNVLCAILGLVLMFSSMLYLWIYGNGLPMNAYPPENFVDKGPYMLFSHPMYIGASLTSFALSLCFESRSGFWFISPLLVLSWLALVFGFENNDLKQRFPGQQAKPIFSIPEVKGNFFHQTVFILLPRLVVYYLFSVVCNTDYPNVWLLVIQMFFQMAFGGSTKTRSFIVDSLFLCFMEAFTLLAFSSALVAQVFQIIGLISLADYCRNSSVAAERRAKLWEMVRKCLQSTANSCSFVRIGSLRIMSHSIFTFLSSFVGIYLFCSFLGNSEAVLLTSVCSLFGGGLLGQITESGSGLSRPFGYFGSLIGALVGSIIASYIFSASFISITASLALSCPAVLIIGRIRCLIHGCCHGSPTNESIGICITNKHSRVCSLSGLANKPIHATQFYSIVSNVVIELILWKLWHSNAHPILLPSLYLIFQGLSRFVEENFRGEPQTPVFKKLKLYQWMSIVTAFSGIGFLFLPFQHQQLYFTFNVNYLIIAGLLASLSCFAYSVDFPESNKRLARLTVN